MRNPSEQGKNILFPQNLRGLFGSMTFFEFLSATARAGIISPDLAVLATCGHLAI